MPHVNRPWRAALTAASATALVGGALVFAAPAQASSARMPIAGTHPSWAIASHRVSPEAVTTGTVDARVYLAGQNQAGLASYAKAVSTPGNALYGHYLTPSQVMAAYGPTSAQVSAVQKWLAESDLTVTNVNDDVGGYVDVTGSVQAAAKAFGVTFGTFKGPDGKNDRAPAQTATAPAGVAGDVMAVSGLDTAKHLAKPADDLPPPGPNYWVAPPCSQYYGQKIAINEPSAYGAQAAVDELRLHPAPGPRRLPRRAVRDDRQGPDGRDRRCLRLPDHAERRERVRDSHRRQAVQTRPVHAVPARCVSASPRPTSATRRAGTARRRWTSSRCTAQAPDANVDFVGAASCDDTDLLAALALHRQRPPGQHRQRLVGRAVRPGCRPGRRLQPGLRGRARPRASASSSPPATPATRARSRTPARTWIQVDYPDSSPWVTSVGGTSLAIGRSNNYEFETSWGTLLDPLAADGKSWHVPAARRVPGLTTTAPAAAA